jgi:hypothetical protein
MGDVDDVEDSPLGTSSTSSGRSIPVLSDDDDDDAVSIDSSVDDLPVEDFPADEQETADTTAHQHYEEGKDQQGIPWERLQVGSAARCIHMHPELTVPPQCCMDSIGTYPQPI